MIGSEFLYMSYMACKEIHGYSTFNAYVIKFKSMTQFSHLENYDIESQIHFPLQTFRKLHSASKTAGFGSRGNAVYREKLCFYGE